MIKPNPTFEAWGRMTAVPGLQYAIELLQDQLNALREELQGTIAEPKRKMAFAPRKKRGRPPKIEAPPEPIPAKKKGGDASWATMTPAQRSLEMRRRMDITRERRKAGLGPMTGQEKYAAKRRERRGAAFIEARQDPVYREKLKSGQQKYWDSLTPQQRSERIKKMISHRTNGAAKEQHGQT